jgi:LCP family protein required for cell wall assembly
MDMSDHLEPAPAVADELWSSFAASDEAVAGAVSAAISNGPVPGLLGVIALPGVAMWRRSPIVGALLIVAGITAPAFAAILMLQHRNNLVGLFIRSSVLRGMALVAVAALASRIVAVWLTAERLRDPDAQRRMRLMGSLVVAALAVPTGFAVMRMEQTKAAVDDVLQESPTAGAATVPAAVDPLAGQFRTVLMVGSDEGSDRLGLRTDSMILALVHTLTGRAALVSIPRNLTNLQFAEGSVLDERYPDGFEDDEGGLVNALYITVENDEELNEAYSRDGLDPGMLALMEGLSTSLGIAIDDYLLINSCGFVNVVDALNGVVIDVESELPMPGRLRCSNYHLTPTIGPGEVYMDGTKALGYVRSRLGDSDYQRMERQRELITTIIDAVGFDDLVLRFPELLAAVKDNVFTSMTSGEALDLLNLLQDADQEFDSVGLAPPLVEPGHPDYDEIRTLMQTIREALAYDTVLELPTEDSSDGGSDSDSSGSTETSDSSG